MYISNKTIAGKHPVLICWMTEMQFARITSFGAAGCQLSNCLHTLKLPRQHALLAVILLCLLVGCRSSDGLAPYDRNLLVVSWDIESRGSDVTTICKQLKDVLERVTPEIVCLSEVRASNFETLCAATKLSPAEAAFHCINGETGGADNRLQVLYDASRIKLLEASELSVLGAAELDGGVMPFPIAAHFLDSGTGGTFWLLHCSFPRFDIQLATKIAAELRKWALDHADDGVVLVGDLNIGFDFRSGVGNETFHELLRSAELAWAEPVRFEETNWSDRNSDGKNDQSGLIETGAFLVGSPRTWTPKVEIMGFPGDFPDSERTSNSRPFMLRLTVPK